MKGHIVFVDQKTKYWKTSILSITFCRCNIVPIKMLVGPVLQKAYSKCIWKNQGNNSQGILNKNSKVASPLDIKFYKATMN